MKLVLSFGEEIVCIEYIDAETCLVDLEKIVHVEADLYLQRKDKEAEWFKIPWSRRQAEQIERPNTDSYFYFANYIFNVKTFFNLPNENPDCESSYVRDPKRGDSILLPEILSLDEWFNRKQTEQNSEVIERMVLLGNQK